MQRVGSCVTNHFYLSKKRLNPTLWISEILTRSRRVKRIFGQLRGCIDIGSDYACGDILTPLDIELNLYI